MVPYSAYIDIVMVSESLGEYRARTSPVHIFRTNQNPVRLSIVLNIMRILFASFVTMVRIPLMPAAFIIFMVDIVAVGLLQTTTQIRSFTLKS